ncbi:MAG: peptide chain release factor N(5)-glutamine methyltransferase [Planctomycetia bacterium]|nr:peptide chain release factor N(5)-glutamine methyltransferase [Planctomycetia bacterium]
MSQADVWTFRKLVTWTTDFLAQKGADSPRLDAEILMAHAANCSRVDVYMQFDQTPTDEVRATFRDFVRRRSLGEPVAYLVGKKEFYSLEFLVDPRVLIPRPETEQLVLETVEFIKKQENLFGKKTSDADQTADAARAPWRICDVGVGSGCISVALAHNLRNVQIVGVDLSDDALALAEQNVAKHNLQQKIELRHSDLLQNLPVPKCEEEMFDVIVSNPPYVSQVEYDALEPTVRNFEPQMALLAGTTGAELAQRLVVQVADYLKTGGKLFLELSRATAPLLANDLNAAPIWRDVQILDDLAHVPRYVVATRQ